MNEESQQDDSALLFPPIPSGQGEGTSPETCGEGPLLGPWANNNQQKGHTMRRYLTGLLKSGITRWSMLPVVLVAAALSVGWEGHHYQLGGSFIGTGGGNTWNATQVPLDPAGRTAAVTVSVIDYGPDFAGLLAAFGADSTTAHWGQEEMINRDTAKWRFVSYGTKQGNPPQICMIYVLTGTLKWTGPDNFDINYTVDIYPGPANILGLPNADANGDGFPDSNATPFLSIPGSGTAKRVSVP